MSLIWRITYFFVFALKSNLLDLCLPLNTCSYFQDGMEWNWRTCIALFWPRVKIFWTISPERQGLWSKVFIWTTLSILIHCQYGFNSIYHRLMHIWPKFVLGQLQFKYFFVRFVVFLVAMTTANYIYVLVYKQYLAAIVMKTYVFRVNGLF